MARLLQRMLETPRQCSYLADQRAQLELIVLLDVAPTELDALLERGYRHFGPVFFRPVCSSCTECTTLRIVAKDFAPSKSQRRAMRTAARFRRVIGIPKVDDERLALYAKWHAGRESERGWQSNGVDRERYTLDFAFPQATSREVAFYDDERGGALVGLGIVDETPRALSAVYFFYDPDLEKTSLGVAHVSLLVEDAKRRGLDYVYLGYRVLGCASLEYKGRFHPHEILSGRPAPSQLPHWTEEPKEAKPQR